MESKTVGLPGASPSAQANEGAGGAGRPIPDYRGYHIYYDPPPIPIRSMDWHFYHEDYDGTDDGETRPDPRHGDAASLEACKAEIDMLEDDQ